MSTTARGDAFEQRVYDALSKELRDERLCASPRNAKILKKKAYHSRDRGAAIITDVSIEIFLPDRRRPSLVWIFECKDYSGAVPVDDIEEFHAKLQQIGEDNTKGTFVTSGALQRSALAYAKAKGIGVIRLLPDDQINIVMYSFRMNCRQRGMTGLQKVSDLCQPTPTRSNRLTAAFNTCRWRCPGGPVELRS